MNVMVNFCYYVHYRKHSKYNTLCLLMHLLSNSDTSKLEAFFPATTFIIPQYTSSLLYTLFYLQFPWILTWILFPGQKNHSSRYSIVCGRRWNEFKFFEMDNGRLLARVLSARAEYARRNPKGKRAPDGVCASS